MNIDFIYMTAGSKEEAATIGRELVSSGLAACVNILDRMNSIYRWQGEIHEDMEVVMIAKTVRDRTPEVIEKVKAMHSYDCPCIVCLPITTGHQPYLDWIAGQVT